MYLFLAMFVVILVLPLLGLFPFSSKGSYENKIFTINMPDRNKNPVFYYPVGVQEVVEWYASWLLAFIVGGVPAFLLATSPFWPATPLVLMAGWALRTTPFFRRQIEYIGWAAEWLVGSKREPVVYDNFLNYSDSLRRGYGPLFNGMTAEQVAAAMRKRFGIAKFLSAILVLRTRKYR